MKILFLGDIAGPSGCKAVQGYLPQIKKKNKIYTIAGICAVVIVVGIVVYLLCSMSIFY